MEQVELMSSNRGGQRTVPTSGFAGAWVFRHRTWLPIPMAVVLIAIHQGETSGYAPLVLGAFLISTGEAMRVWAVRHIGVISRTRSTRLGRLVTSGPYARTRNPLYIGNGMLWTGFVLASGLLWMLPFAWTLFVVQQAAIVPWEEGLLLQRYPVEYRDYAERVPRWWPTGRGDSHVVFLYPWAHVLFSERGTLIAIGAMTALLVIKHPFA